MTSNTVSPVQKQKHTGAKLDEKEVPDSTKGDKQIETNNKT